jgi:hypothetical protein
VPIRSTFVSAYGSVSEGFKSDRMKMCVLWFDEILFEDLGRISRERFLASLPGFDSLTARDQSYLLEAVTPVTERVKFHWSEIRMNGLGEGYPRWGDNFENYNYPEPETPEQFAHNVLLRKIEMEKGVDRFSDGWDMQQAEGRARAAISAINVWRTINEEIPCILQARSDEEEALGVVRSFGRKEEPSSPFTLLQAAVPSLAHLDWRSVAEMRRTSKFSSLRDKMEQIYSASEQDLAAALQSLRQAENSAIEEIVERSRPAPGTALVEGVLGNLPLPGINPFGIVLALKAFTKEAQKADLFEWYYMLRNLRHRDQAIGTTR